MTLALSYQYGHKNSTAYFHFQQLLFQYISFMVQNIISRSEHKCASEHLRRSKQKIISGKKAVEEKQTILLESMQRLR